MATLTQLTTNLKRRVGRELTNDIAKDLLNQALAELSLEADWPWLDKPMTFTTAGTASQTLPFSMRAVKSVNMDGDTVAPISEEQLDAGSQYGYVILNRSIHFYPTPSSGRTVTVRGIRHDGDLSAAGDEPLLPDWHRETLIELAASHAWELIDPARAGVHRANYERSLQTMKRIITRDARPVVPMSRPGAWS